MISMQEFSFIFSGMVESWPQSYPQVKRNRIYELLKEFPPDVIAATFIKSLDTERTAPQPAELLAFAQDLNRSRTPQPQQYPSGTNRCRLCNNSGRVSASAKKDHPDAGKAAGAWRKGEWYTFSCGCPHGRPWKQTLIEWSSKYEPAFTPVTFSSTHTGEHRLGSSAPVAGRGGDSNHPK